MRLALLLAVPLLLTPLRAHMGHTIAQTLFTYGQPVASRDAKPGYVTSTKTFNVSGLTVVCGYLQGRVVMEIITNPNRDFLPAEVEAFLRSESEHEGWSPPGPYVGTMNYQRRDGATASLTGNKLEIITPAWTAALARDAETQRLIAGGETNFPPAPANPTRDISASTTPLEPPPPPKHAGIVITNTAP